MKYSLVEVEAKLDELDEIKAQLKAQVQRQSQALAEVVGLVQWVEQVVHAVSSLRPPPIHALAAILEEERARKDREAAEAAPTSGEE